MDAKDELEVFDETQNTWQQAVQDSQAKILAIAAILVENGICTEQEFLRKTASYDRRLEEERTKRLDERQALAEKVKHENLFKLSGALEAYIRPGDPQAAIDLFRHRPTDDGTWFPPGAIFVRVISQVFDGTTMAERTRLLNKEVLQPFQKQNEEVILPLFLTAKERVSSSGSLYFDQMLEVLGLKPLDNDRTF